MASPVSTITQLALVPYRFLLQVVLSCLNERNIVTLPVNFFINFSPVFIWLMIFKNAGIIPHEWRPPIHVRLMKNLDEMIFSISSVSAWISLLLSISIASLVYDYFYRLKPEDTRNQADTVKYDLADDSFDLEVFVIDDTQESTKRESEDANNSDSSVSSHSEAVDSFVGTKKVNVYMPLNCWYWIPCAIFAMSWIILNFDHWMVTPLTKPKDLFAWALYVLGHFFVPLFTAIWLYVFHTPGALKYYSLCLGLQNIAGVITHLCFPNAPPWFITLYGENASANYEMPGYAAGLIRADMAMGSHLSSDGFHLSPIVFGACPSIHSAMATMSCYFVCYYSRWVLPKIMLLIFVTCLWWSTIYLDHHWRIDLSVGMAYSLVAFTLLKGRLMKKEFDFVTARRKGDFCKGSTVGMRVFQGTFLRDFFDPYS
ncbi:Inositolphosphotransferase [Komagataella phaffii CBS 7435]|uniref:Inositolphosphotransferase 1, involved in synthesis of mannose-(Inositol-P)2-ceramide (M(IP)2C) n=2 Tax=Komagataella phaffii TaxID=460519 RepID=C4R5E8_KOMPG|nr:Inositolphosphotransferase 1, involved in synthesis of mannose-(inositol-P)2-ceramide (M(IP)2C) [Komagataella phaffii GS115]AOA63263.1 GQ67_03828T0 [Komagataella phaffii]CAH2449434.1 Inositolphosphotransferase [Komagataella phaffii CBS 7435]AOA69213.1 GQ68_03801T0 [Komagataella phaffii GS115]CAY70784.1 Inositolphosphotransferase 1, involved in synthesis of mannose-(inositol-P)2-ceramide (M(IP)2C) [Komagataella phaffii GS115]SCV12203.1 Inositolphosphotransferase [Komagataella phaffii CBS 743